MLNLSESAKAILCDVRQSNGTLIALQHSGAAQVQIQGCETRAVAPGTREAVALMAAVDELTAAGLMTGGSKIRRLTAAGLSIDLEGAAEPDHPDKAVGTISDMAISCWFWGLLGVVVTLFCAWLTVFLVS